MKKIYILLLAALSITEFSFAGDNDPNAKKVLDAVSEKFKTFKGITATFSLKSITSKGKDNGTNKARRRSFQTALRFIITMEIKPSLFQLLKKVGKH